MICHLDHNIDFPDLHCGPGADVVKGLHQTMLCGGMSGTIKGCDANFGASVCPQHIGGADWFQYSHGCGRNQTVNISSLESWLKVREEGNGHDLLSKRYFERNYPVFDHSDLTPDDRAFKMNQKCFIFQIH